jgi:glycine cleavage system regulatory protein
MMMTASGGGAHAIRRQIAAARESPMPSLILSVIGSDRPGLTESLAGAVLSAGGNWLESHLSRLGGLYVGSVLVALEADNVDALRTAVRAIDATGLEVRIAPAIETSAAAGETLEFSLVGQDRPGIVRQVTAALSGLDVNIETFDTRISAEPHSGGSLFHMEAHLRLPPGRRAEEVQAALENISAEIMIDISLTPVRER